MKHCLKLLTVRHDGMACAHVSLKHLQNRLASHHLPHKILAGGEVFGMVLFGRFWHGVMIQGEGGSLLCLSLGLHLWLASVAWHNISQHYLNFNQLNLLHSSSYLSISCLVPDKMETNRRAFGNMPFYHGLMPAGDV